MNSASGRTVASAGSAGAGDGGGNVSEREELRIRQAYARRGSVGQRYSLFNPASLLAMHEVEAAVLRLLRNAGRSDFPALRILEVGCGRGFWLRRMLDWGADADRLAGIDLLPDRITQARISLPPATTLVCGNAAHTEFESGCFDLIFQFTAFTSILDYGLKSRLAAEMLRLLRPTGLVIWYDYHANNPWNRDVSGIKKGEIFQLFPDCDVRMQRITFMPPAARVAARISPTACRLLGRLPFLCTHYVGSIRPGCTQKGKEIGDGR